MSGTRRHRTNAGNDDRAAHLRHLGDRPRPAFRRCRDHAELQGFLNLVEPKGIAAGTLYLEVPNDFTASMLNQRMRVPLLSRDERRSSRRRRSRRSTSSSIPSSRRPGSADPEPSALDEYPNPVELPASPQSVFENAGADRPRDSRLNPKYTFDNFVIGQSNRFAHAAAVAVAEAPAKAYNPLFIYGDSGLGKTHLLHAIGHYAMSLYPGIRVRYVSSRGVHERLHQLDREQPRLGSSSSATATSTSC